VIDPSHFGHIFDPHATLVFVTSEPDLERVYVGGELLVERGKLLKHDFVRIQVEVDKRVNASLSAKLKKVRTLYFQTSSADNAPMLTVRT
jgi:hypothetical protein